jgi:hypothetical protein
MTARRVILSAADLDIVLVADLAGEPPRAETSCRPPEGRVGDVRRAPSLLNGAAKKVTDREEA